MEISLSYLDIIQIVFSDWLLLAIALASAFPLLLRYKRAERHTKRAMLKLLLLPLFVLAFFSSILVIVNRGDGYAYDRQNLLVRAWPKKTVEIPLNDIAHIALVSSKTLYPTAKIKGTGTVRLKTGVFELNDHRKAVVFVYRASTQALLLVTKDGSIYYLNTPDIAAFYETLAREIARLPVSQLDVERSELTEETVSPSLFLRRLS